MYQGDNATVVPITLSPFLYSIVPGHFIVFSAISFPAAKAFKLSSTIVSPFSGIFHEYYPVSFRNRCLRMG